MEYGTEELVKGVVESVVFYAPESGWSVVELRGDRHFTAVGPMPKLAAGEEVTLKGVWKKHDIYGEQFSVRTLERNLPTEKSSILRYLASGAIKGIGPVLAERIVKRFGSRSLQIIENSPEKLASVSGISRKMAVNFQKIMAEQKQDQDLALLLLPAGISYRRIIRIKDKLGLGAEQQIREDPWILARVISGVGFETCNRIAVELGFRDNHPKRITGAAVHIVHEQLGLGHTWSSLNRLYEETAKRLDVAVSEVEQALDPLLPELLKLEIDGSSSVCLSTVAKIEERTGAQLKKILLPLKKKIKNYTADVIGACAKELGMTLADEQMEAVSMAMREPFSVMTGGPGTGKTTIIRVLVTLAERAGQSVSLAAPTGRAARRMHEATGRRAMTLHRLLNITPADDQLSETISEEKILKSDLVIVDEASMIDLFLFARLVFALSDRTRLLLVGDADQLPSIGPGQILTDLLAIDKIPRTRLKRIYRQDASNLIVLNAHSLNKGEALSFVQTLDSPFLFVNRERDGDIPDGIRHLIEKVLPEKYGVTDPRDIQILAPMRRGAAGINQLNEMVQALVQKEPGAHLKVGERCFYVGDKVMQTRNNYDLEWRDERKSFVGKGIMNGETGLITALDPAEKTVTVLFEEERLCEIGTDDLEDLELAYAVTIHKSQGSEYPVVILALGMGPPGFMTRNLVYTAFTRAKRLLIVIGRRSTLEFVRNNRKIGLRRTLLPLFINNRTSCRQD
jgi:exodeoxyribonuclease V alpha subunit